MNYYDFNKTNVGNSVTISVRLCVCKILYTDKSQYKATISLSGHKIRTI